MWNSRLGEKLTSKSIKGIVKRFRIIGAISDLYFIGKRKHQRKVAAALTRSKLSKYLN